ncbi:MAG TPA: ATP-binding protein [Candidatus Caccalectryoclostridium excrementigallinarum]|uniref:ATP-binding protein n=1 Tax=Candidatus Caccalectryoclostridium excrementigallinarum TaxID=2840710 RepID=A0A9D1MMK1_9FIRM|nr:ATP-binding protein [Candidatus Caccalectryoclostridium excrementigallinarum]
MEIKRDHYLNKLIGHKKNGLVKIVTGIRRCGKSYLLFKLFRDHLISSGVKEDHIISVALDDYGNKPLLDPDELYRHVKNSITDGGDYYILLDEIQLVKDFESVVNGFLHIPGADVYVTGSNSKFLSSDVVTEFRGRGDEIRVYPLNFSEFYSAYGCDFDSAWLMFCNYGGMPLCLSMQTQEDKGKYLTNLFETTYLADIINRNNLRGNAEINELTDILASSIGSLTNPLKLSAAFGSTKRVKLSAGTISVYLGYLQDAFLIEKALRFDIKGKKYINTPAKYYFVDMGLRNARLSFRQQEYTHIMENVIYNELRARGYSVDVGVVETVGKENGVSLRKSLEVDFVVNSGDRRYYIQSAYNIPSEEKLKREQASLLSINDAFRKLIIVDRPILSGYNEQGIIMLSLKDFLLDPEKALNL